MPAPNSAVTTLLMPAAACMPFSVWGLGNLQPHHEQNAC